MKHGTMYQQPLDSKRTLQAIENKVVSRFLLQELWERQNYATIRKTAGKTLEKPSRWSWLDDKSAEKLPWLKEIDTIPDVSFVSPFL